MTTAKWIRRVIWLSWFTIVYNVAEGVVSLWFGIEEESIALAGFGVDSLIEVTSAIVVLWRFRGETGMGQALALAKERAATRAIGTLFILLAAFTTGVSLWNLIHGLHPETTLPGIAISLLSLSFMFYLWRAKKAASLALNSRTVAQDAACSLACIQLSVVLLIGSAIYHFAPVLGWADAAAALVIAGFIGREGIETIRNANSEDFTGGCGCGCA
ncbi:MAG: heavy metal transporter [Oligoflexia bacterium]|nr:heavy metal transporter [Oligoflexia bacterium]